MVNPDFTKFCNLVRFFESRYQDPYEEDFEGNPFDLGDCVKMGRKTGEVVGLDYSRENMELGWTPIKVRWEQGYPNESWEDYNDLEPNE